MKPLILSIDCGTQSMRAMLFDDAGEIQAIAKKNFDPPYFSSGAGRAEQEPSYYYDCLCGAVKELKAGAAGLFGDIIGVCLTTQRDTACFLDKDGQSVRPAILWLDQRESSMRLSKVLSPVEFSLLKALGLEDTLDSVIAKGRPYWMQENEPQNWEKTDKFVLLSCYLNYKLTGSMADSVANTIGHIPFEVKISDWAKPGKSLKARCFGIDKEKLPSLVPTGGLLGKVTAGASAETGIPEGLPVFAAASDKGCETLGNGAVTEDVASVSFGTTATVQFTTKKYVEHLSFIPPYPAAIPGCFNPEHQIYRGYWMISWFKKEFAALEVAEAERLGTSAENLLNARLNEIPPGCGGLMLQPFWTPGVKMVNAKGAVIGFNDSHTRLHLYRAIIEGINFDLIYGMKLMEHKVKIKTSKIILSGGGSQSDEICQITADMFGLPVHRAQTFETSGLGAAIMGFVAAGHYKDYPEAIGKMIHYTSAFQPDKQNHKIYDSLYNEVYMKLFRALTPLYKTINGVLGIE